MQYRGRPRPSGSRPPGDHDARSAGSALIWALLLVVLTTAMVLTHSTLLDSARRERLARHSRDTLGATIASSGLTDAVGWFRRQTQQPVTAFSPKLDPSGSPPAFDTIDPTLGLVREFQINGNLWGRYEIRNDEVRDLSQERGSPQPGACWEVKVRGVVYRRRDPNRSYDREPNQLVAAAALLNEIRSMRVQLPSPAAINVDSPNNIQVGPAAVIDGKGNVAIGYAAPQTATAVQTDPSIAPEATVTGVPNSLAVAGYDAATDAVFGMDLATLRAYADELIADSRGLPDDYSSKNSVVFSAGDLSVAAGLDLDRVLLVVQGDLEILGSAGQGHQGATTDSPPSIVTIEGVRTAITARADQEGGQVPSILNQAERELGNAVAALQRQPPSEQEANDRIATCIQRLDEAVQRGFPQAAADDWKADLQATEPQTVQAGVTPTIKGVVYVAGDAKLDNVELRGALIVRGSLLLGANGSSEIHYDKSIINHIRERLARYRTRRSSSPVRD